MIQFQHAWYLVQSIIEACPHSYENVRESESLEEDNTTLRNDTMKGSISGILSTAVLDSGKTRMACYLETLHTDHAKYSSTVLSLEMNNR